MTDYIIHIQFEINKKSQQEILLKSLIDYNKQSYLILGHIFDILNNMYQRENCHWKEHKMMPWFADVASQEHWWLVGQFDSFGISL